MALVLHPAIDIWINTQHAVFPQKMEIQHGSKFTNCLFSAKISHMLSCRLSVWMFIPQFHALNWSLHLNVKTVQLRGKYYKNKVGIAFIKSWGSHLIGCGWMESLAPFKNTVSETDVSLRLCKSAPVFPPSDVFLCGTGLNVLVVFCPLHILIVFIPPHPHLSSRSAALSPSCILHLTFIFSCQWP